MIVFLKSILSKIFNKKPKRYKPVNRFETLFIEAGRNPEKREEFYRILFHFELVCLGTAEFNEDGSSVVSFQSYDMDGTSMVAAFTSEDSLRWFVNDRKLGNAGFVGMQAFDLFKAIQGMGLVLHCGDECIRIFTADEIRMLIGPDRDKVM